MVVMGIDPSIRSTGIYVSTGKYYIIASAPTKKLLNFEHPALRVIKYKHEEVKNLTSVGKEEAIGCNIYRIVETIRTLLQIHRPDYIVMEGVAFAAGGRVADLSGLNHCIRCVARQEGIPIYIVPATSNKLEFVGNGHATKDMMVRAWQKCDPVSVAFIGYKIDDLADAYSLACYPPDKLVFA